MYCKKEFYISILCSMLIFIGQCNCSTGKLLLTVAYCPSDFTGAGAIISVDPSTGKWEIEGTFKWPGPMKGDGCPALDDPSVSFNPKNGILGMQILNDLNLLVEVDVNKANIHHYVSPSDSFFTGFQNFGYSSPTTLKGISGTVTQNGYCNDGCFQFGELDTESGKYTKMENIPFKETQDDSHHVSADGSKYYVQAGYDLREESKRCAPKDYQQCLLEIDASSGTLLKSTFTNFTVYKYGSIPDPNGLLHSFIEGFPGLCKHPYEDFLFAKVDLNSAKATPIACIQHNATIHEDEWIGSFSLDGSLYATGSGDADTGVIQLLVFDTTNGSVLLNSDLKGLPQALKSAENFVFIWAVDFV